MLACSDIPDWVACEGLAQYEFDPKILLGDPLVASALFERSPIRHVNNVHINIHIHIPKRIATLRSIIFDIPFVFVLR